MEEKDDGDIGCGPSSVEENQCSSVGRGRRLMKKRVTFSYILRVICESQESCLEWLKNQGFIPKFMSCPNCSRKMKFEKHESALDGYVWVCKDCDGVECTVRHGSWLENRNFPLLEILIFTYLWVHGFDDAGIAPEVNMNMETVKQWDKEYHDICKSLQARQITDEDDKDSLLEAKSTRKESPVNIWRKKYKCKDPFLEFLKDANSLKV